MPGYHKYVFDTSNRKLVGNFEQMYQAEDGEGFDAWFERDLRPLRKVISYSILNRYAFGRILDVGCGKGTFTHLLKKQNNEVVGLDVSETAIRRAKESYPDIDFRCVDVRDLAAADEKFDLIVVMGTFAYADKWPDLVALFADMSHWFYVAEYIPPDPIGFVKSVGELIDVVERHFVIETKVVLDDEHCLLLGKSGR